MLNAIGYVPCNGYGSRSITDVKQYEVGFILHVVTRFQKKCSHYAIPKIISLRRFTYSNIHPEHDPWMLDLVYFSQTLCSHYSFIHLVLSLFLAFGSTLFPYFSCNCGSWWHSNYNCAMTSCFFLGRGCWGYVVLPLLPTDKSVDPLDAGNWSMAICHR